MSNTNAPADDEGESQNFKATTASLPGSAEGRPVTPGPDGTLFEPTFWLRQRIAEIVTGWERGISICSHIYGDAVGVTSLRERGEKLRCMSCATTLNGDACDRCGAGGGTAALFIETRLHRPGTRLDGVVFLVCCGLCLSCLELEVGDE